MGLGVGGVYLKTLKIKQQHEGKRERSVEGEREQARFHGASWATCYRGFEQPWVADGLWDHSAECVLLEEPFLTPQPGRMPPFSLLCPFHTVPSHQLHSSC